MKWLILFLGFYSANFVIAQDSIFYSLDSAILNPQRVKKLIINPNYDPIDVLPDEISDFENLEELYFLPNFFNRIKGGKIVYKKVEGQKDLLPQVVPDERTLKLPESIGKLKKLRTLQLGGNKVEILPNKLFEIGSLKVINLDQTGFKIESISTQIPKLKGLETLSIIGLNVPNDVLFQLKAELPELDIKVEEKLSELEEQRDLWFEIQMHEVYISFYRGDLVSEYFYKSMLKDIRDSIK